MDTDTVRALAALTSDFYARWGASFATTRERPWSGWARCLPHVETLTDHGNPALTVLDLACGNLRFLDFLTTSFPAVPWLCFGVDGTDDMVPEQWSHVSLTNPRPDDLASTAPSPVPSSLVAPRPRIQTLDVIEALIQDDLTTKLAAPTVDLSVCFGFLHHVPSQRLRHRLVDALLHHTRRQGIVILTAWQFANDDAARRKAEASTARAVEKYGLTSLDTSDYLLGWQGSEEAWRYCHSFTDADIDDLVTHAAAQARLIDRFEADGKNGAMNTYLVLQVM